MFPSYILPLPIKAYFGLNFTFLYFISYVEVRDKVEVQKKSPELKARHVLNGNPSVVAKGNGKIEMEEKYNEEKETGHNMITEL